MNRLYLVLLLALSACSNSDSDLENALSTISAADIEADVRVLASDAFEGRAPASAGEEKTLQFLADEFTNLGLEPGNGSSFRQEIPIVQVTPTPDRELSFDSSPELRFRDEYVAVSRKGRGSASVMQSDVVFVGYGIVAPERGWNDYEGLDVAGKTVVALVNDPGYASEDPSVFEGRAMTYYGRWTYKYEEAIRQGARAAVIVHETGPAGYPWDVVRNSWSGPQYYTAGSTSQDQLEIEAWISEEAARTLFQNGGLDFDRMRELAGQPGFRAVPLNQKMSVSLQCEISESLTHNVVARLAGQTRPEETVIYVAHWDHFGRDSSLSGDQIYNGARDNATGTAALLEMAEAFRALEDPVDRSLVFLAVGVEERGLLGSKHYASNPVYPLETTVAAINMDAMNVWGRTKDLTAIGLGHSDLDETLIAAATAEGRTVRPDPQPEKGGFFRSDHFSFARAGVPAIYTTNGVEAIDHEDGWMLERKDAYTRERYHKVGDEIDDTWDLTGMADDLRVLFRVGYQLANETDFPEWKEGAAFSRPPG